MNTSERDTSYYPALTGIRAVAAWMVFIHHFNPFPAANTIPHNLVFVAHTGVTIFFVLSGFLIWKRYQDFAFRGWRNYLRNRFARIYPMFFLLTLLTFIIVPAGDWKTYLLNFTLLKGYSEELRFSGIAQGWTLTVEESFYLFAPLFFAIVGQRSVLASGFRLLFITILFVSLGFAFMTLTHSSWEFVYSYTFFGRCTEFCLGMLLAVIINKKSEASRSIRFTVTGSLLFIIAFIVEALNVRTEIFIDNFVLPFPVAVLLYGLITERSMLSKVLSTTFFQLTGKASYTFYLIHVGVIQIFIVEFVSGNTIVLFMLLNILAVALYLAVERPLNNMLRSSKPVR